MYRFIYFSYRLWTSLMYQDIADVHSAWGLASGSFAGLMLSKKAPHLAWFSIITLKFSFLHMYVWVCVVCIPVCMRACMYVYIHVWACVYVCMGADRRRNATPLTESVASQNSPSSASQLRDYRHRIPQLAFFMGAVDLSSGLNFRSKHFSIWAISQTHTCLFYRQCPTL